MILHSKNQDKCLKFNQHHSNCFPGSQSLEPALTLLLRLLVYKRAAPLPSYTHSLSAGAKSFNIKKILNFTQLTTAQLPTMKAAIATVLCMLIAALTVTAYPNPSGYNRGE